MKKEENGKFILNINLPKGKYQYKFKVDGIWKYNDRFPTINENGIINNIIDTTNWQITSENIEGKDTRASSSNALNNENNKNSNFIFSVPFRYRHKLATFVYYKPKIK